MSRDEHDDFNLKNSLNQELSKAYPLCHLKVVKTTDEPLIQKLQGLNFTIHLSGSFVSYFSCSFQWCRHKFLVKHIFAKCF
jgi:hypothetical protein